MNFLAYAFSVSFFPTLFIQGFLGYKNKNQHIIPMIWMAILTFFLFKNGLQVIWSYLILALIYNVLHYGVYHHFKARREYFNSLN